MMTDMPTGPNPPPQEMHWGIAYLREDIQDLRAALARLEDRLVRMDEKIDRRFQSMMTWMMTGMGLFVAAMIAAIKL